MTTFLPILLLSMSFSNVTENLYLVDVKVMVDNNIILAAQTTCKNQEDCQVKMEREISYIGEMRDNQIQPKTISTGTFVNFQIDQKQKTIDTKVKMVILHGLNNYTVREQTIQIPNTEQISFAFKDRIMEEDKKEDETILKFNTGFGKKKYAVDLYIKKLN